MIGKPRWTESSFTLLSASSREELFKMKPEIDEELIDATFKIPARGFAKRRLDDIVPYKDGRERVKGEMSLIACAFALCVSRSLRIAGPIIRGDASLHHLPAETEENEDNTSQDDDFAAGYHLIYEISERRVLQAASFLFDDLKLKWNSVEEYATIYAGRPLYGIEQPPKAIAPILNKWSRRDTEWSWLCHRAVQLSVLILAFSHIADLEAVSDFPMCAHTDILEKSDLITKISGWDGQSLIGVHENVWFEVITLLTVGHFDSVTLKGTCLLSSRGWSVYLSTFGDADPSYTGKKACQAL